MTLALFRVTFGATLIAKVSPVTFSVVETVKPVKLNPELVAVGVDVVNVAVPTGALLGMFMVALNVHVPPGASVPPEKVNVDVPVTLEPEPQMSV